jgi:shikimate kinase
MRSENRRAIAANCRVAWLQASPETIHRRLEADAATAGRRPNLTAEGGITEIIATLDARRAVYRQCAQLEVDTEHKTPGEVADAILAQVKLE